MTRSFLDPLPGLTAPVPTASASALASAPDSSTARARAARLAFTARRAHCLAAADEATWEMDLRAQLAHLATRIDPHPLGVRAAVAATTNLAVLEDLAKALWVADACAVLPLLHAHAADLGDRPT